jgi:hypothetical protein
MNDEPVVGAGHGVQGERTMLSVRVDRLSFIPYLGAISIVMAVVVLWMLGVHGLGREMPWMGDFDFYWVAGRVWLDGGSTYVPAAYSEYYQRYLGMVSDLGVFCYPPQFSPIAMVMALMPLEVARVVWAGVLLLGIFAVAGLASWMVRRPFLPRPASGLRLSGWLLPAVLIGMPSTAHGLYYGQPSALLAALLMGGWLLAYRGHPWAGGVLLGIATFKPHLLVLPLFWMILDRRWKVLASVGLTVLCLGSYLMILHGPLTTLSDWWDSMQLYDPGSGANTLGSIRIWGLPSALTSLGIAVPDIKVCLAIAMLGVGGLYWLRRRILPDDVLGLLMVVYLGLLFGRRHEVILLAPLFVGLWLHVGHRVAAWPIFMGWILLLMIPERLLEKTGVPIMMFWPTAWVLISGALLFWMSARASARDREVMAGSGGA